jgi:hypothetical protein
MEGSKTVAVFPPKRLPECPGFVIPGILADPIVYHAFGPQMSKHYSSYNLKAHTEICSHVACQPDAEYEYALIEAYTDKENGFSQPEQWEMGRYVPEEFTDDDKDRKPWCYGRALTVEPQGDVVDRQPTKPTLGIHVDPVLKEVYCQPCKHTPGECLRTSPALHSLYIHIATGLLSYTILQQIEERGWKKCLDNEEKEGRYES